MTRTPAGSRSRSNSESSKKLEALDMEPISILAGISASLELLKNAKRFFYPNKTINEALAISSKRMADDVGSLQEQLRADRKSTRLNSSHSQISYAVFCLKKKNTTT